MPADEVIEEKQEPKIDFTYSGQQKLDLGFGPSGSRPAQPVQALSWARLRQVSMAVIPRSCSVSGGCGVIAHPADLLHCGRIWDASACQWLHSHAMLASCLL